MLSISTIINKDFLQKYALNLRRKKAFQKNSRENIKLREYKLKSTWTIKLIYLFPKQLIYKQLIDHYQILFLIKRVKILDKITDTALNKGNATQKYISHIVFIIALIIRQTNFYLKNAHCLQRF